MIDLFEPLKRSIDVEYWATLPNSLDMLGGPALWDSPTHIVINLISKERKQKLYAEARALVGPFSEESQRMLAVLRFAEAATDLLEQEAARMIAEWCAANPERAAELKRLQRENADREYAAIWNPDGTKKRPAA